MQESVFIIDSVRRGALRWSFLGGAHLAGESERVGCWYRGAPITNRFKLRHCQRILSLFSADIFSARLEELLKLHPILDSILFDIIDLPNPLVPGIFKLYVLCELV